MKYLIFLFLPFTTLSQNTTTFESNFQTIESNKSIKIYHSPMTITVTDIDIMITIKINTGEDIELVNPRVNWHTSVDCLKSYVDHLEITYWPKINKISINNLKEKIVSVYYGQIPLLIEIEK